MHPFMPFISEEIYQKIKPDDNPFLLRTEFPSFSSDLVFTEEFSDVELMKKIITETRKTRTENKIDPNRKVNVFLKTESEKEKKVLENNMKYFNFLTKSARTEIVSDFSNLSRGFRGVCLNWEILLPFDSEEDRLNELVRLKKESEKLKNQLNNLEKKLSNESFIDKAPESVVTNFKKNFQENIDKRDKIQKTINDLS
jgi:valyl-tRNA synthetase